MADSLPTKRELMASRNADAGRALIPKLPYLAPPVNPREVPAWYERFYRAMDRWREELNIAITGLGGAFGGGGGVGGGGGGGGGVIVPPPITPIVRALVFCAGFNPISLGGDDVELVVPYSSNGTTPLTYTVERITIRVGIAGGSPSVRIEKSTASGAFSATSVGVVTLASGAFEGSTTTGLGTVVSGNKLRMNVLALGAAKEWTVSCELAKT